MKKFAFGAAALIAMAGVASAQTTTLAYWAQNDNGLPGGGFGFLPSSFPQASDLGSGFLSVGGGITGATTGSGTLQWVQSFAGTTINAQPGFLSGGSIALQNGTNGANNGAFIELAFNASDYENIDFSFAGQRTPTGFSSILVQAFDGATLLGSIGTINDLPGSFATRSLSTNLLDDVADARIRLTFSGGSTAGTASSGNNRLDNLLIQGTLIPAPGAVALAGIAGLVGLRRRRA